MSGSNVTFLRKLSKTAEGITDIDFIIDGVYYQAKRGWSGQTAQDTMGWIAKAKADGATTINYVCPGGEALVPPEILKVLKNQGGCKNALKKSIPIIDVPIP